VEYCAQNSCFVLRARGGAPLRGFRYAKLRDEARHRDGGRCGGSGGMGGVAGGGPTAEGVAKELRRGVVPEQDWSEGEAFPFCMGVVFF
jgi:hypothetical protein